MAVDPASTLQGLKALSLDCLVDLEVETVSDFQDQAVRRVAEVVL